MGYTHDHLILVISTLYPTLANGRDFLVCHPVDRETGNQCGDPIIATWNSTTIPQPSEEMLKQEFADNEAAYRTTFARNRRDRMLSVSDGKANPPADAPDSVREKAAAWGAYRQALRDVTTQPGFPFDINWPALPA